MLPLKDPLDLARRLILREVSPHGKALGFKRGDLEAFLWFLLSEPGASFKKIILVLPHEKDFFVWQDFLESVVADRAKKKQSLALAQFPSLKLWGSDRFVNQTPFIAQRLHALATLRSPTQGIILATLQALSEQTFEPAVFSKAVLNLSVGAEMSTDAIEARLHELGYLSRTTVEEEGQYAVRGGLLDIFSPNYESPVRIEFFGDEISSLRYFSLDSQRSVADVKAVTIIPAIESQLFKEKKESQAQVIYENLLHHNADAATRDGLIRAFLSGHRFSEIHMFAPLLRGSSAPGFAHVGSDTLVLFPDTLAKCLAAYDDFIVDCQQQAELDRVSNKATVSISEHFLDAKDLVLSVDGLSHCVDFGDPTASMQEGAYRLPSVADPRMPHHHVRHDLFDKWIAYIQTLLEEHKSICIIVTQNEHAKRVVSLFEHRSINLSLVPSLEEVVHKHPSKPFASVVEGELSDPVWIHDGHVLLLPEAYLFDKRSERRTSSRKLKNFISSFRELKVGSLVVHVDHGIGRYVGMTMLEAGGSKVDCLQLEYSGGDRIYVPVDRLRLLQRYNTGGEGGEAAPLDKLKGLGWQKRKAGVRKAIRDMADELLKIQAKRATAPGLTFHAPSEEYRKFEGEFPYIETDDQLRAIGDVNGDVEKSRPMDRLICGDVGFGKTEVALRAAYRAVLEGYQVVVLVPTTVLCYQHFRTFKQRMEKHGVNVAQANRFVKTQTLKESLKALESGKLDVLIGTHRILSSDVKVKNLGLLIVDEEQRFGVSHKESLKHFRAGCHVLTLTATPIPRTLHMAMLGLRDISIVATPPHDRLAVKTYISQFEEDLLRNAITSEIARGGQVFFVHNRVEDIVELRNKLKRLVPNIDVRIAHGQMSEEKLEKVILDFIDNKFPVLLCTTIIESGIDMPNVNTLIVNNAQSFGLAQLYQIRGRVGRSSRQAYAYFLVPPAERLTDEANRRLEVLSTHQELGAGFQIARYDLEIRGAGNLLGAEQSGNMADVGLELYTDMLEQAISEIRGQERKEKVDAEIKIPFAALLPPAYISEESLRLDLYKRLFSVENADELVQLKAEVLDRFGPLPPDVELLLGVAHLKWILGQCRIATIVRNAFGDCDLKFGSLTALQIDRISKIIAKNPRAYRLSPDFKLLIPMQAKWGLSIDVQRTFMDELIHKLQPLVNEMEGDDER